MRDPSPSNRIPRRDFLKAAAAPLLLGSAAAAWAQESTRSVAAFPGLIVRQTEPDNLEMPFATLDRLVTPTERFFVRSHFAVPQIDPATWRLRVEGAVRQPLELSLEELRRMQARTSTVLLECAGNSRVFIVPRADGLPWELGAVGAAAWTGILLSALLDRAGVRDDAVEVILEGADEGEVRPHNNPFQTPGRVHYARSLPLAKARRDVLLAHQMNGQNLTAAHGFPLRAIVPGWYGMASIKWLRRIIVAERPFHGFFQTMEYAYYERRHEMPSLTPLTELQVKSLIARPMRNEVVPAGRPYRVFGAAWTGGGEITGVEVSTDSGQTWAAARLLEEVQPHTWRFWEYTWQAPARPGWHVLKSRATDSRGHTQPARHDPDRRNMMVNFAIPIAVQVQ